MCPPLEEPRTKLPTNLPRRAEGARAREPQRDEKNGGCKSMAQADVAIEKAIENNEKWVLLAFAFALVVGRLS